MEQEKFNSNPEGVEKIKIQAELILDKDNGFSLYAPVILKENGEVEEFVDDASHSHTSISKDRIKDFVKPFVDEGVEVSYHGWQGNGGDGGYFDADGEVSTGSVFLLKDSLNKAIQEGRLKLKLVKGEKGNFLEIIN